MKLPRKLTLEEIIELNCDMKDFVTFVDAIREILRGEVP